MFTNKLAPVLTDVMAAVISRFHRLEVNKTKDAASDQSESRTRIQSRAVCTCFFMPQQDLILSSSSDSDSQTVI